MTTTYVAVLLLSLLSCLTTCPGVYLATVVNNSPKAVAVGIGFSAGIMLLVSSLELVPSGFVLAGPLAAVTTIQPEEILAAAG